jgi:hypothetical protein
MNQSVSTELKDLQNKIDECSKEISKVNKLLISFPDLEIRTSRWGHKTYYSKSVNQIANKWEESSASPQYDGDWTFLDIWFWVETEDGIRVHAQGCPFGIGKVRGYKKYCPEFQFEKQFEEQNINKEMIEKVVQYFEENEYEDE